MGEGVLITQEDKIIFANQALCTMYGYTTEEMLSLSSYSSLLTEDEKVRMKKLKDVRLEGQPTPETGETVIIRKDGKILDIAYSRKIVGTGTSAQVVSIIRDITGRKMTEKRLEELAAIVLASDDAIKTISPQGIVLTWNKGSEKLYGYMAKEMIGKHVSMLLVPGKEREYEDLFRRIMKGENIAPYETERIMKGGQTISVSVTASPISDETGKIKAFAIIARDITPTKLAALQFKLKSEELARSNTDLEQFAFIVSHDLREPLRTITSFVQLLQMRYKNKLDKEGNEFIEFTIAGTKRMNELIQDLLAYSRVNQSQFELEQIDCNEILKIVESNLQEIIRSKKAEITYEHLPEIVAGRAQLIQLFQNLIGNALKFNDSKVPKIHIDGTEKEEHWLFAVKDNGIGIETQYVQKIFVIFQRLHSANEYEGTGIGLSICKKIVERHSGKIWCESQPGQGSSFYFTLKKYPKPTHFQAGEKPELQPPSNPE
jgi:PAS domain S-box-containing protein